MGDERRFGEEGGVGFSTILCALDLTEASREALETALELGAAFGARVYAVHVLDQPCLRPEEELVVSDQAGLARELEEQARERFGALLAAAGIARERVAGFFVRRGDTVEELVDEAQRLEADLIVVRTHGRRGIDRYLQRSVAEQLLERAGPPVLALRPREAGEVEDDEDDEGPSARG
ncbi:MAG: universal stress protein [Planctomycetota bacterium]|nr:MAG: universal stress protein [Planctomycetota bacterium]